MPARSHRPAAGCLCCFCRGLVLKAKHLQEATQAGRCLAHGNGGKLHNLANLGPLENLIAQGQQGQKFAQLHNIVY